MSEKSGKSSKNQTRIGLPYINSFRWIMFVALLNLAMAFIFQFGRPITKEVLLLDALICGIVTSIINVLYANYKIRKLRSAGELPSTMPESRLVQKLLRNPALLMTVLAIFFAFFMLIFSNLIIWFYEIETYTFPRFAVWKVIYSTILSAKILEIIVLRFVQPDCAREDDPEQTGEDTIKNPFPKKETFQNLFNTVIDDFGFNLLIGLLFGGTIIMDHNVILLQTTRSGVLISGFVLGIIVTFRMALPVAKGIKQQYEAGMLPVLPKRIPVIASIPRKPMQFSLVLLLPVAITSGVVFLGVFTFFGFEILNFFQFFVIRTIFVALLSKPIVKLAVLCYIQPEKEKQNV